MATIAPVVSCSPGSVGVDLGMTGGDLDGSWGRTGKGGGKAQDFAPRP
jgi:hypothetical protein